MPDYYILGAKRKPHEKWEDRWPDMLSEKVLEVGWAGGRSFEHLYGKPESEIVAELQELGEPPASYNAFKLFLNLRPGDLVAVKDTGSPLGNTPVLTIIAYARVVRRNGAVYRRGRSPLAHCINCTFLDHDHPHTFPRGGYGRTIHRLTNRQHIRQIFAPILGRGFKLEISPSASRMRWQRSAAALAKVEDQTRQTKAQAIRARQTHHRMRNKLFRRLVAQYGGENVAMEQDYVDLRVSVDGRLTLYEVKPHRNVLKCVRDALGQVLLYAWREATLVQHRKLELVVVGPNTPNREEREFIGFLKHTLKIAVDYMPFGLRAEHSRKKTNHSQ